MSFLTREVDSLRRVFQSAFGILDIAESLASFDAQAPASLIQDCMENNHLEVVGIRQGGRVTSYIEHTELDNESTTVTPSVIEESQIITDTTSLVDVVLRLKDQPFLFVSILGQVSGVVCRQDLQKPASRMWLFGMVTLIEMRTCRLIERFCVDENWQQFVSEGRLAKAQSIQADRARRLRRVRLLDCLQLSDKLQIVARNPELRKMTRFDSRKQMEHSMKAIEKLRDNLAHAQDIISDDWEVILSLAENFEKVLSGPPGLQDEIEGDGLTTKS